MIIDTNIDVTPHLSALKAAGITTVIRYLSPINPAGEKCIKPAEAHRIASAGLRLALVCEGWGDFAHGGISAGAGERDGEWCATYAPTVGAPAGAAIYYAVDTDANAAQVKKLVLPYFASIRAKHGAAAVHYRIGVYGSGTVLSAVTDAGNADLDWLSCSLGWSGSRAYFANGTWMLRQHTPSRVAGIDCDGNDANGEFGDFLPFSQPRCALPEARSPASTPDGNSLAPAVAGNAPPAVPEPQTVQPAPSEGALERAEAALKRII